MRCGRDRSRTRRGHEPQEEGHSVSTQPTARRVQEIALERIQAGGNVRELNADHVSEGAVCQAQLRRLPRTSLDRLGARCPGSRFAWAKQKPALDPRELYPDVVDGPEEEGGVPSRLIKTDAGEGRQEGTPWTMFAGSRLGRRARSRSRWTSWRVRALAG